MFHCIFVFFLLLKFHKSIRLDMAHEIGEVILVFLEEKKFQYLLHHIFQCNKLVSNNRSKCGYCNEYFVCLVAFSKSKPQCFPGYVTLFFLVLFLYIFPSLFLLIRRPLLSNVQSMVAMFFGNSFHYQHTLLLFLCVLFKQFQQIINSIPTT